MKIYLASTVHNDFREGSQTYLRMDEREKEIVRSIKYRLDSYHYINNERMNNRMRTMGCKIFLDSGAFSAYTQGVTINLKEYAHYIKSHPDFFEVVEGQPLVSVLDAIGDPDETYRNQKRLEAEGVRVLPCYHYGEPEEVLQYYIEHYDYITIGGMVPISSPQLKIWLDRLWGKYLTNPNGEPIIRVHGFGMTSAPLMERYPWYSVDSSSWVQLGGMGAIYMNDYGNLHFSEHSPTIKEHGKHFNSLPKPQQEFVRAYVEGLGFNIERLIKEHISRKVFNMLTYLNLMEKAHERFILDQPLLF